MQFLSVLITGLLAPILAFAAPADVIQSGQNYKLINVQGGTAIDLSAGDHHTSILFLPFVYH